MTCNSYKDQPENYERENIVALEEVLEFFKLKKKYNNLDLLKVNFTKGGFPINIDEQKILDWFDTGLSNLNFFEIIMYEELEKIDGK